MTAHALQLHCHGDCLLGVLHAPEQAAPRAVLVITGGPQYRVGSHRQFVLLARHLAAQGTATMRFDYRGMGDSAGRPRGFDAVSDDIRAAIDHLFATVPVVREVVLWGLCDGATAAAFYAAGDQRVAGLVLLNPWVRSDSGWARATLRQHYVRRLLSPGFWRRLFAGHVSVAPALASLGQTLRAARRVGPAHHAGTLPERLHEALARFRGRTLIILSGADIGAREFQALPARYPHWRHLLESQRVTCAHVAGANHTFACRAWRDQVADLTSDWLQSW